MDSQETPTNRQASQDQGEPTNVSNENQLVEEEEGTAVYRTGGFHPVYVGDVFNDRYEVINKIGYGVYSTVWLVKDLKNEAGPEAMYRALKVLSAECYGQGHDTFEKEILTHLRNGSPTTGYDCICHLIDDFQHTGPNGIHVCLVFELMGETLRSFGSWFRENQVPYLPMRKIAIQLFIALYYAHSQGVIHTDIKPDNAFVRIRDHSLIESYLARVPKPKQDRTKKEYTPVLSWPLRSFYFNEEQGKDMSELNFCLGDWGVASWKTQHLSENIQPVALRAPEVLLRAPWDEKVDYWNLGAIIYELFCSMQLFSGRVPPDSHYEVKLHLQEILVTFGPFPKELLEKGKKDIVEELFDGEGNIKDPIPLDRPALSSELVMPGLKESDREEFASFLRMMMKISPAERPSVEAFLRHPWINAWGGE